MPGGFGCGELPCAGTDATHAPRGAGAAHAWQEEAPRFAWTVIGREVVFVTAVTINPDAERPVVALEHEVDTSRGKVAGSRTARIAEDWRSHRPDVRV